MPPKSLLPCRNSPPCPGLVRGGGYCDKCKKNGKARTWDESKRGNSRQRGYDTHWTKTSLAYRNEHPLCEDCLPQGRTTPAEEVHHILPISTHPELKYDSSNLVALCRACHRKREGR